MDILQIALVFLILLLAAMLSILGIQVFFILKDLRRSLDKLDVILEDAKDIADSSEKAVSEVADAIETGAKVVKTVVKTSKPVRRLFRKH